jgi:hypothetical protein
MAIPEGAAHVKNKPLQFKRGTAKAFLIADPILLSGQPAFETDTYKMKVGNGRLRYSELPYIGDHSKPKDGKSAYEVWLDEGYEGSVDDFLQFITGPAGKSAYEIWLSFGNEGTLQDFLDSLIGEKGDSAYQCWLDDGNVGTLTDFLNSLVGKSAYQIWLDLGHTGTEEDFIASLKGDRGEKGDSAFEVWKKEYGTPESTYDDYFEFLCAIAWGEISEYL